MRYPSVQTTATENTNRNNEKKEKNTMRQHILAATLAATLTVASAATAAPARPTDPGMGPRDRDLTPIVRIVKAVKKFFGITSNNLPATPIP